MATSTPSCVNAARPLGSLTMLPNQVTGPSHTTVTDVPRAFADQDPTSGVCIAWRFVLSKEDLHKMIDPEELRRRAMRAKGPRSNWTTANGINNHLCLAKYNGILRGEAAGLGVIRTGSALTAHYIRRRLRAKGYCVVDPSDDTLGDVVFRV